MAERFACRRGESSSSSSSSWVGGEESESGRAGAERDSVTQPAARSNLPRRHSQEIRVSYPRNWGGKVILQSRTPSNEEPTPAGGVNISEGGISAPVNIDNDITMRRQLD